VAQSADRDALKAVEEALESVEDKDARQRILDWVWAKYSDEPKPITGKQPPKKTSRSTRKTTTKTKQPSMVKTLDLRPQDGPSFKDFVATKKPRTNHEKCAVVVYYLKQMLEEPNVGPDHVFTCFREVPWRMPSRLYDTLALTAHSKGWLNTSDMDNIAITPSGINLVEYDLTRAADDAD
jgi:hypothetical protein